MAGDARVVSAEPHVGVGPDRPGLSQKGFRKNVAAVVVLFEPPDGVLLNIDSYRHQVDSVVVVDNSTRLDASLQRGLGERGVELISLGGNRGIATALNVGCRRLLEVGYEWALTMDQDSTAPAAFVERLGRCTDHAGSGDIAVIAPMWDREGAPPVEPGEGCSELLVANTSGSLLRLAAFEQLGDFRDDFFVDQVDNEFCLRARRNGLRVVQRRDTILLHRMGNLRRVRGFGFSVMDYSPLRRYYQVRNTLQVCREYGDEFPEWVDYEVRKWRRELVKLILAEPRRIHKIVMMFRGWWDYRRGRFGPYGAARRRAGS